MKPEPHPVGKVSNDPCFDKYNASLQCLAHHNYDRARCAAEFEDYRECRKVTSAEKLEERRAKNAEHSIGNVLLHLFAGNKEKD